MVVAVVVIVLGDEVLVGVMAFIIVGLLRVKMVLVMVVIATVTMEVMTVVIDQKETWYIYLK